ncbi:MAG: TIGR03960 family B12-binding radical SAM protein, partial [Candidatus Omnitrophica bacterium]|nr:TIGR03960 family B12-binding radical SAM protein [Candidatus Omnitrophota bacterium]
MDQVQLTDEILLNVRRPARYIGEEHNSIKKRWSDAMVKVCLCYPDTYELGMSHLGLKILYHILNKRDDTLCERSFAPWLDMEEIMRKNDIRLFSLESKMGLASFDIIGFSLGYELTYTNLLNMLDLSKIPLRSHEREGRDFPLIIAGGTCAFNPEPLADFIDCFVIGDGEEAIIDLIDIYKKCGREKKQELLKELSLIDGLYVPSCYDSSKKIKKRTIKDLTFEYFPTAPIVPYIQIVHDRITLEIMRGCPNSCHFCQAKSIYSPVRIRKPKEIVQLAEESYKNTGFDEVSLLSLSSSNYPGIDKLINKLTAIFSSLGVGISLPSLRIEKELDRLPLAIWAGGSSACGGKKSGLTFAPEVATEKMQRVVNKLLDFKELFTALRQAYKIGWKRVKLYFMIGLPEEEREDLEAIVALADRVALLRKEVSRGPAEVTISISSFIPKPHTAFERLPMASLNDIKEKQQFLVDKVKTKR